MNPEQKVAYVIAQAACMMVEAIAMQTENQARARDPCYGGPAFTAADFEALIEKYGVHHNGTISIFQDWPQADPK